MRQHTPGPWRIGKGGMLYGAVVSDTSPHPRRLDAEQADEVAAYGGYLIAESIVKQNRPLIAMAPELLATCQDANLLLSIYCELQGEWAKRYVLQAAIERIETALGDLEKLQAEATE